MLKLVPAVQTAHPQLDLCKALIEAWRELFNETPLKQSVGIILAQNAIETGGKYFWCNNWGNVKVGADDPNSIIEYCMLKNVWEILNGKKQVFQPPSRQTWFRSFPTLLDGAKFHLDLLKNKRYKSSWAAVEQGSVINFATLLRDHGYYTASLQDYIAGMNRFYQPYMKTNTYEHAIAELDSTAPPLQPWVEIPVLDTPMAELQIVPDTSQTPIRQGIDEAEQVSQSEIESRGSSLAGKFAGYLGSLLGWLQKRK